MLILAFETSAKAASVALSDGAKLLGENYQNTGLTHSQTLLPMAQELLKSCGKTPEQVEAVAVAAGPGSFTGIRIGVSASKGLAFAVAKPAIGVSTLASISQQRRGHRSALRRREWCIPPMRRLGLHRTKV